MILINSQYRRGFGPFSFTRGQGSEMPNEFKVKNGLIVKGDSTFTGKVIDSAASSGVSGYVLTSTGSGVQWAAGGGGSSGTSGYSGYSGYSGALSPWTVKTANYTAANNERIIANTTGGTFTITLPATPSAGNYVVITDGGDWSTTNLIVARNGSTIEGAAENMTVDMGGITVELIYSGSTWQVTATTGRQGFSGVSGYSGIGGSYVYYDSNTTNTLNYNNGPYQRWAPTGSPTLAISNWPSSGIFAELVIEGINLGAATITWPTVNWVKSDGSFTTTFADLGVTLQSSGTDFIVLWTRNGGTTVYGKVVR